MGLISAFTLIRTISLFHITAAYFFLAAPETIVDQNVVFILGESVRLVCHFDEEQGAEYDTELNI